MLSVHPQGDVFGAAGQLGARPYGGADALLRELSDAGCTIRDKDAVIRQLQQELQEAQGINFSAQNDQAEAANLLQAAREEHEAETQDLVSKFSQAQDLAAFVSSEMSRIVEELKAVKDENRRLASEGMAAQQLKEELQREQDNAISLQQEVEILRAEGAGLPSQLDADIASKEEEIASLQHEVAELEARALGELGEMHDELLDLRETCFKLQIALTDSERRRDKMQQDKHMMEQQLQEAGGADLERQLSSRNSSCSEDDGLEEDASSPAQEASPAVSQAQYQQLREEADLVMLELVTKKMELAEINEECLKTRHDLLWEQQKCSALESKLAKTENIVYAKSSANPLSSFNPSRLFH